MPRATKKRPDPDSDSVFVAWQSGSAEIDGQTHSVAEGEHRRGSDPFVQAHPWLFIEDGATEGETPTAFTQLVERHDAERAAPDYEVQLAGALPTPLAIEDTIQLTRAVTVRGGYPAGLEIVSFEKDAVFPAASEIASLLPDDAYVHTTVQFTKAKDRRRR